jgi:Flp pilus assembly protein TadG
MYVIRDAVRRASSDRGGVLVMVALWMPVVLIMSTFVIDVGNWFVHKRHLQMQADAAAWAAAQEFRFPCSDAPIVAQAEAYSGASYNAQIGGTPAARVFRKINSKTFHDQPLKADDTVESPPCSAAMIDVKLTEVGLPFLFKPIGDLISSIGSSVPYINARARVAINQMDTSAGSMPVGVPAPRTGSTSGTTPPPRWRSPSAPASRTSGWRSPWVARRRPCAG